MKRLYLLTALVFTGIIAVQAQTQQPNQKYIDECFEHSSKTPAAFDRCVKDEFQRLRDEAKPKSEAQKEIARLQNSTKPKDQLKLFYLGLERLQESRERLYATPHSGESFVYYPAYVPTYYPRTYYFRYYPRRFYPRYSPRYFPRTIYKY